MNIKDEVDAVFDDDGEIPIGVRVLVVDDDPGCLKAIETILRKCQFNVTTTCQPMEALKMLREDKNGFEIVLVDVSMPEIDGFQLLQLIRLEMNIPVITLSSHNEPEYVMKGLRYGACDHLAKPCQILELRNIWRHVVKRRFMNKEIENNRNREEEHELAQPEDPKISDDSISGEKRKNRTEGEEELNGESGTDDPVMTPKKQRVVWSTELHDKFVAAIEHLTLEKAVPKKILDWMSVEGLTRENVASHLQKYRLFLKRTEAAKEKQETMKSMEGFGLPESRRFRANPFLPTQQSEACSTFDMNLIVSRGLSQQNTSQNMNHSFGLRPQSQLSELYNRNMRPLEVNPIKNLSGFSYPTRFPSNRVALTSSMNFRPRFSASPLIMQGNQGVAPSKSEPFDQFYQGVQLSNFPSTSFGPFETRYHPQMPSNNSRLFHGSSLIGQSSVNAVENLHPNFLVDPINGVVQTVNSTQKPNGQEHQPFSRQNPNHCTVNPPPLDAENMVLDDMGDSGIDFNSNNFLNMGQDEFLQSDLNASEDKQEWDHTGA